MSANLLRRPYRRLLAVHPSDWRAANETVVLDTLLEAAGPTRRWPSPRETLALLVGGVRVRIGRLARGGAVSLVGVAAGARGAGDRVRMGAGGVGGGRDGVAGGVGRRAGLGGGDR
jgi:hypothetical protein